jgi:hypothetical protein
MNRAGTYINSNKFQHLIMENNMTSRFLILLILIIFIVGYFYPNIISLGWNKLPGDFFIKRGGFEFYIPLTSAMLVSSLVAFIYWIIKKYC